MKVATDHAMICLSVHPVNDTTGHVALFLLLLMDFIFLFLNVLCFMVLFRNVLHILFSQTELK